MYCLKGGNVARAYVLKRKNVARACVERKNVARACVEMENCGAHTCKTMWRDILEYFPLLHTIETGVGCFAR